MDFPIILVVSYKFKWTEFWCIAVVGKRAMTETSSQEILLYRQSATSLTEAFEPSLTGIAVMTRVTVVPTGGLHYDGRIRHADAVRDSIVISRDLTEKSAEQHWVRDDNIHTATVFSSFYHLHDIQLGARLVTGVEGCRLNHVSPLRSE